MYEKLRYGEVEKVMNFLQEYSPSLRADVAGSLTFHPLELEAVMVLLDDRVFSPSPRMLNSILRTRGHDLPLIAEETGELRSILGDRYQTTMQLARSCDCTLFRAIQQQPFMKNVVVRHYFADETRDLKTILGREMQKFASVSHPSFAAVIDGGSDSSGNMMTVHELVEGTSLLNYVVLANLDYKSCLELLIQVCRAIEYTEFLGLTGLNFMPSQFLVSNRGGQCCVFHTGFAPGGMTVQKVWRMRQSVCCQKDMFCLPPEIYGGEEWRPDSRANVFFIGGLLYLMMTGANPLREYGSGLEDLEKYAAHIRKYKPMSIANFHSSVGLRAKLLESMDEEALLYVSDSARKWMRVHGDKRPSSTEHLASSLVNEYHRVLCRQNTIEESNLAVEGKKAAGRRRKLLVKGPTEFQPPVTSTPEKSKWEKFRVVDQWARQAVVALIILSGFLLFDMVREDLTDAMDNHALVTAAVYGLATLFVLWCLGRKIN